MNGKNVRIAAVVAAMGIMAAVLALPGALAPAFAASNSTTTSTTSVVSTISPTSSQTAIPVQSGGLQADLAVGQVITITSTQGHYRVIGDSSKTGIAAGTLTLSVIGKFARGYSISVTGGSLSINGTTYTITSGSAEIGPRGAHLVGQGVTTASGAFLIRATAHGNFGGVEQATASLDFGNGTTEYAVSLVGTIQG